MNRDKIEKDDIFQESNLIVKECHLLVVLLQAALRTTLCECTTLWKVNQL